MAAYKQDYLDMFVPVGSVPKKRPRKLTQPTQAKKKAALP
jgi:hypothetical protein